MNTKILDCTLRDGGHVNNADFGKGNIKSIINGLIEANIDYVELGFLKDGQFTESQALFNDVTEIYPYLPEKLGNSKLTVMIRPDWYDINQLSDADGRIDIIRFAFYYRDFKLMSEYAATVEKKGFRFICNPVNIMGYSSETLTELIKRVNEVHPEQMTMVDTYGSMTISSLHRIYEIMENTLDKDIRIGLHLHENQSLAFGIAQEFLKIKKTEREIALDASLLGMGRIPGNLCIEIMTEFMNQSYGCNYNSGKLYQLIGDCIAPIKQAIPWGYSPEYFITAKYNMHRSYAEAILKKNNLNLYDIYEILKSIDPKMRSEFYKEHLEQKYQEYARNRKA